MRKGSFDLEDDEVLRDLAAEEASAFATGIFEPDVAAQSDRLAKKEAAALESNENLDTDGKKKEHGRHQRFQEHANNVVVGLLWTVATFTLIGMSVYVWHLIMLESARWLSDSSLD
ncbi:hypothetical protein HX867_33575, partial [Pseudomonas gingeri]|uniref:hypothetical protein n=1 Tax=Pseudomonas gingeri TaxID=117681 RepID=UPI0015A39F6E